MPISPDLSDSLYRTSGRLKNGQCYTCGAEGHKAEDCTERPLQQKNASQGRTLPTCQICQNCGHIASECWHRTAATLLPKIIRRMQKPQPTATCTEKALQARACIAHSVVTTNHGQPEVKLACGRTLLVLQRCLDQAKVRLAWMPLCRGRVFEKNVSVLRCSTVLEYGMQ